MISNTDQSKALIKTDVMQSVLFEDDLVTYETAFLAREKGFDIDCGWKLRKLEDGSFTHTNCSELGVEQPTQSLLQKWLRETHNIDVCVAKIGTISEKKYYFQIMNKNSWINTDNSNSTRFLRFEDALEIGLFESLQLGGFKTLMQQGQ